MRYRLPASALLIIAASVIEAFASGSYHVRADSRTIVTAISVGDDHACVLTDAGGVKCWGANTFGQLGDERNDDSATPVDVLGLTSGVMAIAAGDTHSCAVTFSGGVKCWGANRWGQLGDGVRTDSNVPMDVAGLATGITAITAGAGDACALTAVGSVKCWGNDTDGQLGATSQQTCPAPIARFAPVPCSDLPLDVSGLNSGVAAVSASEGHTCALLSVGGVECWGEDTSGQLGNGIKAPSSSAPVDVVGLKSDVVAISSGSAHSCAVTTNGAVKCWGLNDRNQLGDGTTTTSSIPVDVLGLTNVASVSLARWHSCALTEIGGVDCWGDNGFGELGIGVYPGPQSCGYAYCSMTTTEVQGLHTGVIALSTGSSFTCAVTSMGHVKCWGGEREHHHGIVATQMCIIPCNTIPVDVDFDAALAGTGSGSGLVAEQTRMLLLPLVFGCMSLVAAALIALRRTVH